MELMGRLKEIDENVEAQFCDRIVDFNKIKFETLNAWQIMILLEAGLKFERTWDESGEEFLIFT